MAMGSRKAAAWLYRFVWGLQIVASSGAVIVGAALRANTGQAEPRAVALAVLLVGVKWVQGQSLWVLPVLVLASAMLSAVKRLVGDPWVWEAVQRHLDSLQKNSFDIQQGDALHEHRVTLFKHVGFRLRWGDWPWTGWLVPVARSGHTSQHSITVFKAPDAADNAEGVAGRTWATRQIIKINELPDLTPESSATDVATYARNTWCPESRIKGWRPRARSFCGIPVVVKGRLWGVLVLDSRSANGIRSDASNLFDPMSDALAKLLERI